jgi:hypothetical protein
MKQLLVILAIATSLTSYSQGTISATISAGTVSPTVPDTLVKVPYAILIEPILINALTKDTAYQVMWNVQNISRDTAVGSPCNVNFYNRKGGNIYQSYCYIPKEIIKNWGTSDDIIDDYIIAYYRLIPVNSQLKKK